MKNLTLPLFLFIILIFASCSNKKVNKSWITAAIENSEWLKRVDSHPILINQSELKEMPYMEFNKLIKEVRYIPLQSKEPIGEIREMAIYKDRIIILDAYKSESVFIFDLSGSLINIIHDKGEGPTEYFGLEDMSISKLSNEIVINDRLSLHTLFYSLDGTFIKKVKSSPNSSFEMMGDKWINQLTFGQSYNKGVNYHLIISREDSIIRKGFSFYPLEKNAVNANSLAYNYKDELLFSPSLSDTIYHIINDSMYTAKYVVNQEKSIWNEKENDLKTEEYRDLVKHDGFTYLGKPILESHNYLCYPICSGDNGYIQSEIYWYDKVKKISFTMGIRKDESSPIYGYIPNPHTMYGNYFAGIIEADGIEGMKNYIKQEGKSELFQNESFKSILTSNMDNLECILVLYSFK